MTKTIKVEGPMHVVCQCDKCKAQPEKEQGEPVSDPFDCGTYVGSHIGKEIRHSIGDYLPAQKPWVGLTDEDLKLVAEKEREACAKEADATFYSVQAAENIRARRQA
jgi:hypothetical protein